MQHAASIREKGVDTIVCVSVNDAFVMDAWGKDQGAGGNIMMVGDGNGEFTKAIGLEMDGSGFGLGTRSLRYSMIVRDGVVDTLNIESNPGEAVDSGAENLMSQLYLFKPFIDKRPFHAVLIYQRVRFQGGRYDPLPIPIRLGVLYFQHQAHAINLHSLLAS